MNERLLELRQQRGELLARIEAQRGLLAGIASTWERPLALADRGVSVLRFLRSHPLVTGAVVAFVVLRRRGVAGGLNRAWQMWKSYRYFAGL